MKAFYCYSIVTLFQGQTEEDKFPFRMDGFPSWMFPHVTRDSYRDSVKLLCDNISYKKLVDNISLNLI